MSRTSGSSQALAQTGIVMTPANNGKSKIMPSADKQTLIWAYREMLRSRLTDEKTIVLYKQNKCHLLKRKWQN